MLHSFRYYISRERDQDLSVSIETTQQTHQLKTETYESYQKPTDFCRGIFGKVKVRWQLYYIFS